MEVCHRDWDSQSPAIQRLGQFVRTHTQAWALGVPDLERFERELHEHMLGIECEYLGDELARYDVTVDEIEVAGVVYRPILTSPETYRSTAGPVTVSRHLYRPTGRGSKSICPLDLRAGIIEGIFTPRAARQAAFVTPHLPVGAGVAHLTSGESQAVLTELGGLSPSRSRCAWIDCPRLCPRTGKRIVWSGKKPCVRKKLSHKRRRCWPCRSMESWSL